MAGPLTTVRPNKDFDSFHLEHKHDVQFSASTTAYPCKSSIRNCIDWEYYCSASRSELGQANHSNWAGAYDRQIDSH